MALTDKLTAIANAIRAKTGGASTLTLDQMAAEIASISTGGSSVSGYSGTNAELVGEYADSWDLSDTSFEIGVTAPSSTTTIRASESAAYTSSSIAAGDKDIVCVQKLFVKPTHSDSAANKAKMICLAIEQVSWFSKRKSSDGGNKTTRQILSALSSITKYYNSSQAVTRLATSAYGITGSLQAPSLSSTSSANMSVSIASPVLSCRTSSTYESATNMKLVTDCEWNWSVEIYTVDAFSSVASQINDDVDDMITADASLLSMDDDTE